jgi:DNA-binding response OmpR family regulator
MTPEKVLIIEDDPSILRGLKDNFTRVGYTVTGALEGNLGLQLARAERPDLIILDIMLPGMSGWEIVKELRAVELEMPILIVSALGREDQIIKGLNLGADDYVTKPFSIQELLARAASLLRRKRRQTAQIAQVGRCVLNRSSKEFQRDGKPVELTPKEIGLLEFFLDHPHRAVTRSQILMAVWGADVFITERSVDRVITLLRQNVEEDPSRPRFIRTVQKVGYRFEPPE